MKILQFFSLVISLIGHETVSRQTKHIGKIIFCFESSAEIGLSKNVQNYG